MLSDCRKGECGLCEVRIAGLEGDIDHRDVFYSERQRDARGKMCCCVSRIVAPAGREAIVEPWALDRVAPIHGPLVATNLRGIA